MAKAAITQGRISAEKRRADQAEGRVVALEEELRRMRRANPASQIRAQSAMRRVEEAVTVMESVRKQVVEAERKRHLAETRLSDIQAGDRHQLETRATRLADKSRELGELGVKHALALNAARATLEEAERGYGRKLDEIEQHLRGPHEKRVLCPEWIRRGERAVPCHHVFHEDCMLPGLRDGAITSCPLDRKPVDPAAINR